MINYAAFPIKKEGVWIERDRMFKICPKCSEIWNSRSDFLADTTLELIGYQSHFKLLTLGLLLFNHSCGTTLSIFADEFKDLYDGPTFKDRLTGTKTCPGYCLNTSELRPCPNQCECAYVREIVQRVKNWRGD